MRRPEVLERIRSIGGIQKVGRSGFIMMQVLELRFIETNGLWTFDMGNEELLFLTGIKNRDTLNDIRNKLLQLGIIKSYKGQKGKSGGTYTLNEEFFPELSAKYTEKTDKLPGNSNEYAGKTNRFTDNFTDKFAYNLPDNFADNFDSSRVSSISDREIDREIDRKIDNSASAWSQICDLWISIFEKITFTDRERLASYQEDDGMSPEVILAALELANQDGIESPKSYLWTTLNDWAKAEIKTVRDVIKYERERESKIIPMPGKRNGGGSDGAHQRRSQGMARGHAAPPSAADFLRKRDQERQAKV